MEQKLVLEVRSCKKCMSKALKIAATAHGVTSVALEGERKERLVVVGEGVDPVCLVKALRKKIGFTEMVNFSPLTKEENDGGGKNPDGDNETNKPDKVPVTPTSCACQHNWPPYVYPIIWADPCSIL